MKITMKTGAGGPRHDPYSCMEWTIHRANGTVVTLHSGLVTWVDVDGERTMDHQHASTEAGEDACIQRFEAIAGCSLRVLERAHARATNPPRRCPRCDAGYKKWRESSGYVGESMIWCGECGMMIWCEPVTKDMIE